MRSRDCTVCTYVLYYGGKCIFFKSTDMIFAFWCTWVILFSHFSPRTTQDVSIFNEDFFKDFRLYLFYLKEKSCSVLLTCAFCIQVEVVDEFPVVTERDVNGRIGLLKNIAERAGEGSVVKLKWNLYRICFSSDLKYNTYYSYFGKAFSEQYPVSCTEYYNTILL